MTTAPEIVRAAIPDATDATCEHVLWGMTPFPVGRVLPREIFRAASRLRRAEANGVRLCEHCDQRAMPDEWYGRGCGDVLSRQERRRAQSIASLNAQNRGDLKVRKIIYAHEKDRAPPEVWLEWSVLDDGSEPVLEDDFLSDPRERVYPPVRDVRAE